MILNFSGKCATIEGKIVNGAVLENIYALTTVKIVRPDHPCPYGNELDCTFLRGLLKSEIVATFRNLKTELGLRAVCHQKQERVNAHLFISMLAYHLVHTLRHQLKIKGINLSWESIRNIMATQQCITWTSMYGSTIVFCRMTRFNKLTIRAPTY